VPDDEQEPTSGSAERLVFFSDAVVAIAITLLAIDLPVPGGDTVHAFWQSFRDNDDHYLAFLISFVTIAAAWSRHHDVFRYLKRIDSRFRAINMAWLMMIVLNPFATKLLTSKGNETTGAHALRFGFYALLQVLLTAAMLAMVRHMNAHQLQAANTPSQATSDANWGSYAAMLGFALSIPLLFATPDAWLLWFLVPMAIGRIRSQLVRPAPDPERVEPAESEPEPRPEPGEPVESEHESESAPRPEPGEEDGALSGSTCPDTGRPAGSPRR
jgi:uncharacterized membrane protein